MAEQCIVCLGDLRESLATLDNEPADPPEQPAGAREHAAEAGDDGVQQHQHAKSLLRDTNLSTQRYHHLLILQAADPPCT